MSTLHNKNVISVYLVNLKLDNSLSSVLRADYYIIEFMDDPMLYFVLEDLFPKYTKAVFSIQSLTILMGMLDPNLVVDTLLLYHQSKPHLIGLPRKSKITKRSREFSSRLNGTRTASIFECDFDNYCSDSGFCAFEETVPCQPYDPDLFQCLESVEQNYYEFCDVSSFQPRVMDDSNLFVVPPKQETLTQHPTFCDSVPHPCDFSRLNDDSVTSVTCTADLPSVSENKCESVTKSDLVSNLINSCTTTSKQEVGFTQTDSNKETEFSIAIADDIGTSKANESRPKDCELRFKTENDLYRRRYGHMSYNSNVCPSVSLLSTLRSDQTSGNGPVSDYHWNRRDSLVHKMKSFLFIMILSLCMLYWWIGVKPPP